MEPATENLTKRWTYEEYYHLEDDRRYEIVEGALREVPGPDTWHQNWVGELHLILRRHVDPRRLGKVLLSPIDVVLDPTNTVQPDLVFVSAAKAGIIQHRAIFGAPDLVVELLSPGSVRRDRVEKSALYARFGVREYWIGDPANKSLEVFTLQEGRYERHAAGEVHGAVTSVVLAGLEFDVQDLG